MKVSARVLISCTQVICILVHYCGGQRIFPSIFWWLCTCDMEKQSPSVVRGACHQGGHGGNNPCAVQQQLHCPGCSSNESDCFVFVFCVSKHFMYSSTADLDSVCGEGTSDSSSVSVFIRFNYQDIGGCQYTGF